MSATYGEMVRLTLFGESHGKGIGLVLDGVPAGTPVDEGFIRSEMARRAPGRSARRRTPSSSKAASSKDGRQGRRSAC